MYNDINMGSLCQVTILILIDGFLQWWLTLLLVMGWKVTILILIDGFLQCVAIYPLYDADDNVTILILIDGFLQYSKIKTKRRF